MDFFRSQWGPRRSVQPEFPLKMPEVIPPKRTTRIVQIPVHFGASESTRSASALKIQKAFRGFLARKSVQNIMSIKREVDAIEARISRSEVLDFIRKDGKERLKVNETLMALLFKLDAVSGMDSGIRVCRRAVIKKAISLQERVDSIANDPIQPRPQGDNNDSADAGASNSEDHIQVQNFGDVGLENVSGQTSDDGDNEKRVLQVSHNQPLIEPGSSEDTLNSDESMSNARDNMEGGGHSADELECAEQNLAENCDGKSGMKGGEYNFVKEGMVENTEGDDAPDSKLQVDSSLMEDVEEEERCDKTPALSECLQEGVDIGLSVENGIEVNEEIDVSDTIGGDEKDGGNDNKKNKELLERMIEDNGKMMKMMTELFERNEAQARMLNALTHRLEQLEKAFVCDKTKRKKKRHCS